MNHGIKHRTTSGLFLALAALVAIIVIRVASYQNTARLIQINQEAAESKSLQHAANEAATTIRRDFLLFLLFSFLDAGLLIAGYLLLRHYIHQRDRAEREMSLAKEAAEKANRAKDVFVAMVSHDLRSPLNAIGLWLTLLRRDGLRPEERCEALDSIEQSVADQTRLVSDLLDISRIVHGKFHVERTPMDLVPSISAAVATVRSIAESKGITLQVESQVRSFVVLGDGGRLQQVVWNLLSNAVKFTPHGGQIFLRLRHLQDGVEFEVADTGRGISAEFLPHMFDRFAQSDMTGEETKKGLGLGLAIVKHIIELHEGTVAAHSAGVGHGATLTVRLPGLGVGGKASGCDIQAVDAPAILPSVAK